MLQQTTSMLGIQTQIQDKQQLGNKSGPVIISPEEHEMITKLYQKYDESGKLISQLESSFQNIEKSANECQENVKKSFDDISQALTTKKTRFSKRS